MRDGWSRPPIGLDGKESVVGLSSGPSAPGTCPLAIVVSESDACVELLVPKDLRQNVAQVFALTDGFCAEHLDDEYAQLCRRLVVKLVRKRPSPLARGDLRIWAAAALYTVGQCNFLFDRAQEPHLSQMPLVARAAGGVGPRTARTIAVRAVSVSMASGSRASFS
ncbi:MAG: DUF6398 domain-containing protein [Acidimicrobiales bacterium]